MAVQRILIRAGRPPHAALSLEELRELLGSLGLTTDGLRQTNLFNGEIVGERDEGTTWVLLFRLARPGTPSQGSYDLEIEIPKLVYERLAISTERHWDVSIHPGSIQVLPGR